LSHFFKTFVCSHIFWSIWKVSKIDSSPKSDHQIKLSLPKLPDAHVSIPPPWIFSPSLWKKMNIVYWFRHDKLQYDLLLHILTSDLTTIYPHVNKHLSILDKLLFPCFFPSLVLTNLKTWKGSTKRMYYDAYLQANS